MHHTDTGVTGTGFTGVLMYRLDFRYHWYRYTCTHKKRQHPFPGETKCQMSSVCCCLDELTKQLQHLFDIAHSLIKKRLNSFISVMAVISEYEH